MTTDPYEDVKAVVLVAGLCLAGYLAYRLVKSAPAAAAAAVDAVNPASQTNLVNRGVTAAGAAITGDDSWTLGGQLAEWFSPSVKAANDMLNSSPTSAASDLATRPIDYGTGAGWDAPNGGVSEVGSLDPGSDLVNPFSLY